MNTSKKKHSRSRIVATGAMLSGIWLVSPHASAKEHAEFNAHEPATRTESVRATLFSEEDFASFVEATNALRRGDLTAAKARYLALQARLPPRPEILNNLAAIEHLLGNQAEAARLLAGAAELDTKYLSIYNNVQRNRRRLVNQETGSYTLIDELPSLSKFAGDLKSAIRRPQSADLEQRRARTALAEPFRFPEEASAPSPKVLDQHPPPVTEAQEHWRRAWQAQDITAYLSWYDIDFEPGAFSSKATWVRQRRATFAKPKGKVDVKFENIAVSRSASSDADQIEEHVEFTQTYRADDYADIGRKTMRWRWKNGQWRILREVFNAF